MTAQLEDKPTIGVAYLAWQGLGKAVFRQFADSYRRYPAGREHDLIVIYAGFDQQQDLSDAASVFSDIPHIGIELPTRELDIVYYLETAQRVPHEYLCFLNTYTELRTGNWLAYLATHASRDDVGIVGTTASYESLFSSVGFYEKIKWMTNLNDNNITPMMEYYFGFYLKELGPYAIVADVGPSTPSGIERSMGRARRYVKNRAQDAHFHLHWKMLTGPKMPFADYGRFPEFPNPHIRTNGFMLRRLQLAPFKPSQIQTKFDTCVFESGFDSLTAQLRRKGLAALVVASDGQGYDVPDWCRSGTFRLGDQSKLILTDNRSRDFANMSPGERFVHVRITWGDYLGPAPADFPNFGYSFAKGSLNPRRSAPAEPSGSPRFDPAHIGSRLALSVLQLASPGLPPARGGSLLVRKARSAARQMLRAALPPFRRLDERMAADARLIAHLESEIVGLRERVHSLEGGKNDLLAQDRCADALPVEYHLQKE